MKKILIACGSGVATSTVANQKISTWLDCHGFAGQYSIEQCKVAELPEKSQSADFAVTTSVVDEKKISCPVISAVQLLTGMGLDQMYIRITDEMKK